MDKAGKSEDGVSRRAFVASSLAAGFALSVQPVSAETITTDSKGIAASETKIKAMDAVEIPAYQAMPDKGGPFPVVLVVQEIFGVHEHIKDVCRRLAKAGYFAIAPELYARQGDVSKAERSEIMAIVGKVPDAQVMSDLDAAVGYAISTGKAHPSKLAVTGFCWGGRVTWLYAAHNPKVKAGAAWYGRLTGEKTELQTLYPLDVAEKLGTPVLGLYGEKDGGIPLDTVEQMKAALAKGKSGSKIIVYKDAQHGFHADYRPSYNEKAAKEAWKEMLKWFKANGAA